MRAQLIPLDGSAPVDIQRDLTLVGRKEECDLRLDHKSVSKMHCVIVKTDGLLLLRDLGSTNGTRVNGQRVRRAALLPNDQLTIANYKFRVYLGPDNQPVPTSDFTHQLESGDLVHLGRGNPAGPADAPGHPLQPNLLPDVYPENGPNQN
jgi:pSer/pThr/pTyr-binding forkhead associated (FHA) protein